MAKKARPLGLRCAWATRLPKLARSVVPIVARVAIGATAGATMTGLTSSPSLDESSTGGGGGGTATGSSSSLDDESRSIASCDETGDGGATACACSSTSESNCASRFLSAAADALVWLASSARSRAILALRCVSAAGLLAGGGAARFLPPLVLATGAGGATLRTLATGATGGEDDAGAPDPAVMGVALPDDDGAGRLPSSVGSLTVGATGLGAAGGCEVGAAAGGGHA